MAVERALVARGLSVHAYDQRGHGRSDGRRGDAPSFDRLVADLNHVASSIVGRPTKEKSTEGTSWFVVGHSMGGLVVLRFLQTRRGHGALGAVLMAPWLATARRVPPWKRLLGRLVGAVAPGLPFPTGMDPDVLTRDPGRLAARARDEHAHSVISPRLFEEVEKAQVAALRAPAVGEVLFVVPGDDLLVDAGVTSAYATRQDQEATTVLDVPGARHEAWNDLPREDVFRGVARWMDARLDTKGASAEHERGRKATDPTSQAGQGSGQP